MDERLMVEQILNIQNLSKRFGKIQALDHFSMSVEKGSVYGILGPNGSGKTTTLNVILDVIPYDSGTFQWFGQVPSHILRRRIGSLVETPNFLSHLSAERNLKITADIKAIDYADIDRVLKMVDLHHRRKDKFKSYSLGMKQRLAIAAALLGKPEVLILDEPTNGLDPQGISETRELIMKIAKEGITIIMASHMLDEVEKICSHVAIIKSGKLLVNGRVDEILSDENSLELKADDMQQLSKVLADHELELNVKMEQECCVIKLPKELNSADINQYLFENGVMLTHLCKRKKKLEMQFLEITN